MLLVSIFIDAFRAMQELQVSLPVLLLLLLFIHGLHMG